MKTLAAILSLVIAASPAAADESLRLPDLQESTCASAIAGATVVNPFFGVTVLVICMTLIADEVADGG